MPKKKPTKKVARKVAAKKPVARKKPTAKKAIKAVKPVRKTTKTARRVSKPKKAAAKKLLWTIYVLDESGSMGVVRQQVISGYKEYIESLKKNTVAGNKFSLTKFHNDINRVHTGIDVSTIPELTEATYVPDKMTALYDAIGITIRDTEAELAKLPNGNDYAILMVINTDGQENASKEFTAISQIQKLIKEKEATGRWTFIYVGANQDAWAAGASIGISQRNIAGYKVGNTQRMMKSLGENTALFSAQVNTKGMLRSADFYVSKDGLDVDADDKSSLNNAAPLKKTK